jgi:serine/threonine protein kinase
MDEASDSTLSVTSLLQACGIADRAAELPDPLLGRDIGGVLLVRMLAEGGMGRVYEGRQEKPSRSVAVKVLRPGLASREIVRRFSHEAEILGRLRHPAIAQIFSAGAFPLLNTQVPYFVMEYIPDALPITQYAHEHDLSLSDRLDLFATVIDAVAHGHAQGVIHRDLKPGNILVGSCAQPKVIDFGIARSTDRDNATTLTQMGQVLGTLQSMSPEQISATTGSVDARSDIYSLGVVLYELLTDEQPYALDGVSVIEAAHIIQKRKPPSPQSLRPDIPRVVSSLVDRCLAKDPARRFASAKELAEALAAARFQGAAPSLLHRWLPATMAVIVAITAAVWARHYALRQSRAAMTMVDSSSRRRPAASVQYSFTAIADADPHLVSVVGARKYHEWQSPPIVYWGPIENRTPAQLTYRFDFPAPPPEIRLIARTSCWDFTTERGGVGRGASAIEVSSDGKSWHVVRNGLEPPLWGVNWDVDEPVPPEACSGKALWVRVRLLAEDAPNGAYTTAQFGRSIMPPTKPVFAVTAGVSP